MKTLVISKVFSSNWLLSNNFAFKSVRLKLCNFNSAYSERKIYFASKNFVKSSDKLLILSFFFWKNYVKPKNKLNIHLLVLCTFFSWNQILWTKECAFFFITKVECSCYVVSIFVTSTILMWFWNGRSSKYLYFGDKLRM